MSDKEKKLANALRHLISVCKALGVNQTNIAEAQRVLDEAEIRSGQAHGTSTGPQLTPTELKLAALCNEVAKQAEQIKALQSDFVMIGEILLTGRLSNPVERLLQHLKACPCPKCSAARGEVAAEKPS